MRVPFYGAVFSAAAGVPLPRRQVVGLGLRPGPVRAGSVVALVRHRDRENGGAVASGAHVGEQPGGARGPRAAVAGNAVQVHPGGPGALVTADARFQENPAAARVYHQKHWTLCAPRSAAALDKPVGQWLSNLRRPGALAGSLLGYQFSEASRRP
ncbi:helicase associated domain-containing protein [Streptomyces niveus]|uniref:helicase associated domain-containing protein n=1 Tax=Streptomyces niveus TaxID=193462 RepID=UPI0036D35DEE